MSFFQSFRKPKKEAAPSSSNRNQQLVDKMRLSDSMLLDPDSIAMGKLLGQGGFAKVYQAELGGKLAVAKVIPSEKLNDEMCYLLQNEVTVWAKIKHPNVIEFFGMACTEKSILLLCEYMAEGSLLERHDRLLKAKVEPPPMRVLIEQMQQLSSGMEFLHAVRPHPILHRDLKSANILCAEDGHRLAIADFGLARFQGDCGVKMTAETGSYRWMAPEVIRHEEYDIFCDVYSFAILAWEMLTYRIPFDNMMPVEAAFAVAREAKRPPIPSSCPSPVSQMLTACWSQDANHRPTFAALCVALEAEKEMLPPLPQASGTDSLQQQMAAIAVGDNASPAV